MNPEITWRSCSSCKKSIGFKQIYWVCNVSTCNRKRTGLTFCSVDCWDAHVPMANHRESWALESIAPGKEQAMNDLSANAVHQTTTHTNKESLVMTEGTEKEVLIVTSKLKNYIRNKSGMNTSAAVTDVLSDKIRELCDQAVENAKREGRKTVMDRDFL